MVDLSKTYTCEDYLSWKDDIRRELIDGAVKLMSGVNRWHAKVSSRVYRFLANFFDKPNYMIFYAPFDVFLSDNTVVQPDIGIVCDLSKVRDNGIYGAPDFLVEIISPSSVNYDFREKFSLYEKHGVKEYWIVDPKSQFVKVFLLQSDGQYDSGALYDYSTNQESSIKISIVDDFQIKIKDIFKE